MGKNSSTIFALAPGIWTTCVVSRDEDWRRNGPHAWCEPARGVPFVVGDPGASQAASSAMGVGFGPIVSFTPNASGSAIIIASRAMNDWTVGSVTTIPPDGASFG